MSNIVNKCKTKDALTLDEISVFATDVKNRSSYDIERLKKSIVVNGFLFPLFIWKGHNIILDGKSRFIALKQLKDDGYVLEKIPIVFVSAKDESEAREKVLQVNSRYGKITEGSLNFFAKDCEINLSDLNIHLDKINFSFEDKSSTIEKGKALVFGGGIPQNNPEVSPSLTIASSAVATENPFETGVNNGSIEESWANSTGEIEHSGVGSSAETTDPFDLGIEEFAEPQNIPVADAGITEQQQNNVVTLTCPFCYQEFELSYEEIAEILQK